MKELGIPFKYPVAKTGIVANVGKKESPKFALRSDMDALPILASFHLTDFQFLILRSSQNYSLPSSTFPAIALALSRMLKFTCVVHAIM